MPGPRPDDNYNSVPSVAPTTQAPSDYLNIRSNPNQFGAQTGGALEKTGSGLGQVGDEGINIALQQQGLLNEHAANMADMQLAVQGGQIYDQFKQLEGLNAAQSKDKAISDYLAVSNKIRDSLGNPSAQRAYDQVAARRMSYTIQDMNSYAADQTKVAYRTGNNASMNLSIDQASKFGVATNPNQFGFELGNVRFQTNAMFTSPDYGKYRNLTATTNKDGTLSFDQSTPEGKIAQVDYDSYLNKAEGQAWENRIKTLALDPQHGNVINAVQILEDNKDKIPAVTYAKLSAELAGPYKASQTRGIADSVLSEVDQNYNNSITSNVNGFNSSDKLTNAFISQESGGKGTNLGQIQPNTWQAYAKPGEDINNPKDNAAVTQRILQDYSSKYNGDPQRIAVAYFSGPSNVAPAGSPTPWIKDLSDKTGKTVSSYVSDILQRLGSKQSGYQSQTDYYRTHYNDIVKRAEDQASQLHGDDPAFIDQARVQIEQKLNDAIRTQELSVRAAQDSVVGAVTNPKAPITNIENLDHSLDPQIRSNWLTMQANDPFARNKMTNIIMGNSRGNVPEYGSDFYNHYMDVLNGKVHNPTDLANYVDYTKGKDSPITNTGFKIIQQQIASQNNSTGALWAKAQSTFFGNLYHKEVGPNNGEGDAKFSEFMQIAIPQIQAAEAAGKSPNSVFDPKSPEYVGKALDSVYPVAKRLTASKDRAMSGVAFGQLGANNQFKSIDSVTDPKEGLAILKSRITDAASRQRVIQYAVKRGWIQPPPPSVPLPD